MNFHNLPASIPVKSSDFILSDKFDAVVMVATYNRFCY